MGAFPGAGDRGCHAPEGPETVCSDCLERVPIMDAAGSIAQEFATSSLSPPLSRVPTPNVEGALAPAAGLTS